MKFTVKKEVYASQKDFGALQITELCNLLGLTFRESTYGYGKADYRGHQIDLTFDRSITRIMLHVACHYSDRVSIKELSEIQIKNLVKKIDKLIDKDEESKNLAVLRENMYKKLTKLIPEMTKIDRYSKTIAFLVDKKEFSFIKYQTDDNFLCTTQIYTGLKSYLCISDTYESILEQFEAIKLDYFHQKNLANKALEIIIRHKKDILTYFDL